MGHFNSFCVSAGEFQVTVCGVAVCPFSRHKGNQSPQMPLKQGSNAAIMKLPFLSNKTNLHSPSILFLFFFVYTHTYLSPWLSPSLPPLSHNYPCFFALFPFLFHPDFIHLSSAPLTVPPSPQWVSKQHSRPLCFCLFLYSHVFCVLHFWTEFV